MNIQIKSILNNTFITSRQALNKQENYVPYLIDGAQEKDEKFFSKPVQNKFVISFCGKGMKRLKKMIREEEQKERLRKKELKEREQREKLQKEKINKPLPAEIEALLDSFDPPMSAGKKKALSIGYNIRNDKKESLYFLNEKGDIIDAKNGNEKRVVTFSNPKYEGCISVHNHPVNCSFSSGTVFGDVSTMIGNKFSEMIVTTSEGFYTLSRPKKTDFKKAHGELYEVTKNVIDMWQKKHQEVLNKKITKEEGDKQVFNYLDTFWHGFAKNTGWKYEFKKWK